VVSSSSNIFTISGVTAIDTGNLVRSAGCCCCVVASGGVVVVGAAADGDGEGTVAVSGTKSMYSQVSAMRTPPTLARVFEAVASFGTNTFEMFLWPLMTGSNNVKAKQFVRSNLV